MKYDFITVGGATRDISFFTDQGVLIDNKKDILRQRLLGFEYGAKIKVDKFYYSFGGGAANAAVCLSNFGLNTACLACLGGDEGEKTIINNFKEYHVKTNLIKINKSAESGSSFILVSPSGERIIFGSRGANHELVIDKHDLKILKETANIYLSSLSGAWLKNLRSIFSVVTKDGPKIFWNPGGQQLRAGLKKIAPFLKKTTVFSINKDEAIELILSSDRHRTLTNSFLNKEENLLEIIKSFGPKIVIITMGENGVIASDDKKTYHHQIIKEKKRVDTTGIGDVFNSSFAAGFVCFSDLDRALVLALHNTAAKISHLGAQNGLLIKNLKKNNL
ncbi:MAG: carbohydrate kinase family protein [Candidatus Falkowbacteria bacterium]